ncbi:MAG: hypothetical protein ACRDHP_10005, partial [Ktedonobacterales bacterium]
LLAGAYIPVRDGGLRGRRSSRHEFIRRLPVGVPRMPHPNRRRFCYTADERRDPRDGARHIPTTSGE